ncbi:hypothetical protein XENOCAPTIV_018795, partial [Xenoophorus captivus]
NDHLQILSPVMLQLEQPQLIQSRDPFTSEPLCTVPLQTTLSATTISTCQRWSTGSVCGGPPASITDWLRVFGL